MGHLMNMANQPTGLFGTKGYAGRCNVLRNPCMVLWIDWNGKTPYTMGYVSIAFPIFPVWT